MHWWVLYPGLWGCLLSCEEWNGTGWESKACLLTSNKGGWFPLISAYYSIGWTHQLMVQLSILLKEMIVMATKRHLQPIILPHLEITRDMSHHTVFCSQTIPFRIYWLGTIQPFFRMSEAIILNIQVPGKLVVLVSSAWSFSNYSLSGFLVLSFK